MYNCAVDPSGFNVCIPILIREIVVSVFVITQQSREWTIGSKAKRSNSVVYIHANKRLVVVTLLKKKRNWLATFNNISITYREYLSFISRLLKIETYLRRMTKLLTHLYKLLNGLMHLIWYQCFLFLLLFIQYLE